MLIHGLPLINTSIWLLISCGTGIYAIICEPPHGKPTICIGEIKGADQISAFVFATLIVETLFYLNPKFQASNLFLCQYRLVCVGPGWKPKLLLFSCTGSCVQEIFQENQIEYCHFSSLSLTAQKMTSYL